MIITGKKYRLTTEHNTLIIHFLTLISLNNFRVFDEDGSGSIDFEEFMMILNFKNSTHEDKLGKTFLIWKLEFL